VEKNGVYSSRQSLQEEDLILFMLNYNEALTEEDYIIFDMIRDLNYIVIVNKTDLHPAIDMEEVRSFVNEQQIITTSLKKDVGIDDLEIALSHLFLSSDQIDSETAYVSKIGRASCR